MTDIAIILDIAGGLENFFAFHANVSEETCLDTDQFRKRLPDDIAKSIIFEVSNCNSATEFQKLSLVERNKNIQLIHKKGVSIRQLNRLTGTPRGIIERVLSKRTLT